MTVEQTTRTAVGARTVDELRAGVRGTVICRGDPGYDAARKLWNGRVDKHPALIVHCAGVGDVIRAVRFARRYDLEVAVRGGGHSIAGLSLCDGGLVIDLSRMKSVRVAAPQCTAWAEAGLTLGEFIHETQAFGLATTVGTVSHTGLAGLTLGGGMGYLMGKYGLTIDHLLAADIVTADGTQLTASASEHPDLFWALRGGGGNFGIVTAFHFQLHPVGPVLAGMIGHPLSRAKELLRFYHEFIQTCPDELTVYLGIVTTPDGHPAVIFLPVYCGDLAEGERALEPLRRFAPPVMDTVRPMRYLDVISQLDAGNQPGWNYYEKSSTLPLLSDDAIEALVEYGAKRTAPRSAVLVQHVHGAAARVDPTASAFALRYEHYAIVGVANWTEEEGQAEQHIAWGKGLGAALRPYAEAGVYVNALGNEGRVISKSYVM